jgi:hypothetical protein
MNNIIFRTKFGSVLYGTNTPASDEDWKSIRMPSAPEILLGSAKETLAIKDRYNKAEKEKNLPGEYEEECFTLKQYLKLVSEGQTVSLDMLFAPYTFWDEPYSGVWLDLIRNRSRLISKKSGAFVGYCRQQAKKYGIKGSRVAAVREVLSWLNNVPFFSNSKLGDHEDIIENLVFLSSNREHIFITEIEQASGTKVKYLDVCGRKLQYTSKVGECVKVIQHLMDEYGQRALQAENNDGVDWKALSHAVRIGQQALELFDTGFITFPRPNAQFLLRIKKGEVPYKSVAGMIEFNFEDIERASKASSLPEDVDHEWINDFIFDRYLDVVMKYGEWNGYEN